MLDPPVVVFWSTVPVKPVLSTKKKIKHDSCLQSLGEIKPLLLYSYLGRREGATWFKPRDSSSRIGNCFPFVKLECRQVKTGFGGPLMQLSKICTNEWKDPTGSAECPMTVDLAFVLSVP
jgi:hypothetical protein